MQAEDGSVFMSISPGFAMQVEDGNVFPADLVLLASTHPEGVCYIETMNLDGETNLKLKKVGLIMGTLSYTRRMHMGGVCPAPTAAVEAVAALETDTAEQRV